MLSYYSLCYPGASIWRSEGGIDRLLEELKPVFLPGKVVNIIESIPDTDFETTMIMAIVIWALLGKIDDDMFLFDGSQEGFEAALEIMQRVNARFQPLILAEQVEKSELFSKEFFLAVCEPQPPERKCFPPFLYRAEYLKAAFETRNKETAGGLLLETLRYGLYGSANYYDPDMYRFQDIFDTIKGNILGRRKGLIDYCLGKREKEKLLERARQLADKDDETQLAGFKELIQTIYAEEHITPYHSFYFYHRYLEFLSLLPDASKRELLNAITRYGTEGAIGLYDIEDGPAKVMFAGIKPSITASQKRHYKAKKDGRKGGRPERFPRKLFVMMATRGFCSTREMAAFLGCSLKTVENKISDDEIDKLQQERLERLKARKGRDPMKRQFLIDWYGWNSDDQYEGRTYDIVRDPRMIPLLRDTGIEKFKDLDENNIPSDKYRLF